MKWRDGRTWRGRWANSTRVKAEGGWGEVEVEVSSAGDSSSRVESLVGVDAEASVDCHSASASLEDCS